MSPVPAAPGPIAASRLGGDEHAAAMRQAKLLPDPARLAKGELRDAVECVCALADRRNRALQRRGRMLTERAQVHREDVRGAEPPLGFTPVSRCALASGDSSDRKGDQG